MLSNEKIAHLSHIIVQEVMRHQAVTVKNDRERMLKTIKRVIVTELAEEEEIDRKVRSKLASYSRRIVEGSTEWEILYRKAREEETRRRNV